MILIFVALIFQKDNKVCILKLVMLVKLAFVMQRLKKYKKIVMINKDGGQFLDFMGGRSCYEGGHRAHAGSPLGKTLVAEK